MNKEYLRTIYRRFSEFVAVASARELEYFVLDSKFTSSFNYRIKKMVEELKEEGKENVDASIMFNTKGEVALIDANILGSYIGYNYNLHIENYYQNASLNKVVKEVVNGNEKTQCDFIKVSYSVIYNTMDEIYSEVTCKKDVLDKYKEDYMITEYHGENNVAIIVSILILEDICKYLGFQDRLMLNCINSIVLKKKCSQ
jgi:hypothetical protein